jgi:hypothetical protein
MYKSCVLSADKASKTSCINLAFCTVGSLKFNDLRTSTYFYKYFKPVVRLFVHIKCSLNSSVDEMFSTVSTRPTIDATNLILNNLYIVRNRRTAP